MRRPVLLILRDVPPAAAAPGTGSRRSRRPAVRRCASLRALTIATFAVLALPAAAPAADARWCRSGEPPVEASRRTSCAFADRIATRVHLEPLLRRGQRRTIHVRSPEARARHRIRLVRRGDRVTGTGRRGIWVRFAYVGAHWCRYGDPPIRASNRTPCTFAGRILNRVYNGPPLRPGQRRTIHVRSPVTHRRHRIRLILRGNHVTGGDRRGIWVHFLYQG